MRTLAIGDIHGCLTALTVLEQYVPITAADRVITLGDYIDRGQRTRRAGARCWSCARRAGWSLCAATMNGCSWKPADHRSTSRSGCSTAAVPRCTPTPAPSRACASTRPRASLALPGRTCVPSYETETHFFVHANAYPDLPLASSRIICSTGSRSRDRRRRTNRARSWCAATRRSTVGHAAELRPRRLHRHLGLRRRLADVPGR